VIGRFCNCSFLVRSVYDYLGQSRRIERHGDICSTSMTGPIPVEIGSPDSCRYCCKSPKLPGPKFLAVKKSYLRPPIDVAPITLPRSPASLSSGDEVPHIFTRKSRVQPKEFLISSAKRLLQQNLPTADICTAANDVHGAMIPIAIGRLWRQSSLHERRAGVPSLRPVATSIDVRRDRQKGPKQWLAVRLHALPFARPIQTQASR
jgi:hypothetical protein